MSKITIDGIDISILKENGEDYISLTDMIKAKDGDFFVTDWNRNTLEFLSVWEGFNNSHFNYGEFDLIKSEAGLNSFKISVKESAEKTGAIGIIAKAGRYGGTYAHKDIAFEFGTWISLTFKLYLIKEFQRLKEEESKRLGSEWDFRRYLAKANYRIHTDAIKDKLKELENIIPTEKSKQIYNNEAELLNYALFNFTAQEWKKQNPKEALQGLNPRDLADAHELIVMSNLESLNALMIRENIKKEERLKRLRQEAIHQLKSLRASNYTLAQIESPFTKAEIHTTGSPTFNDTLKGLISVPPPPKKEGKKKK